MAKKTKRIQRKWSKDELKLLKKLFPIKETKEVAEILGRSLTSVHTKAFESGLKKAYLPPRWTASETKLLKKLYRTTTA